MTPRDAEATLGAGWAAQVRRWGHRLGSRPEAIELLQAAATALADATADGHVCLPFDAWWIEASRGAAADLARARALLRDSGLVGRGDAPGACPFVLDAQDRLYLQRDFDHERALARELVRRARAPAEPVGADATRMLRQCFGLTPATPAPDEAATAAALALRGRLTVISGGPGSGKTTTVARLLGCLLAEHPEARVVLAAPTGKAAARLIESMRERAADLPAALRDRLPKEASTVHRLLGASPEGFRHGRENPLTLDVLVVDEASMLDLALARRLFDAVPERAKVLLLGDPHQLAAVESGAVFADLALPAPRSAACAADVARICGVEVAPPANVDDSSVAGALGDCSVALTRSRRFDAQSAIGRLAEAVRTGRSAEVIAVLGQDGDPTLRWLRDDGRPGSVRAEPALIDGWEPYWDAVARNGHDPDRVLLALQGQRLLCAVRDGPRGTLATNQLLAHHTWRRLQTAPARHYAGQPLIVLRNDPMLRLFNGDVGVVLADERGALGAWFPGLDGDEPARQVALARLPPHETAFAMTVHKAQGSEFDRVTVLLPERASRVLTRELLYTAVTRARRQVAVVGGADIIALAVAQRSRRHGGLLTRMAEAWAQADRADVDPGAG